MTQGWILIAILAGASCGGAQRRADQEQQQFDCRERMVSYIATNHIGGDELGVHMDCETNGPRIKRWRMSRDGQRVEDERAITPRAFDKAWKEIVRNERAVQQD